MLLKKLFVLSGGLDWCFIQEIVYFSGGLDWCFIQEIVCFKREIGLVWRNNELIRVQTSSILSRPDSIRGGFNVKIQY